MSKIVSLLFLLVLAASSLPARANGEEIFLAGDPALSPDGATLLFSWRGDIWSVPSAGGTARQITSHTDRDSDPCFSPDGTEIAFTSSRAGGSQVFVMKADGSTPEQVTWHSAGSSLRGWYPDGKSLLVSGMRDHFWRDSRRLFRIDRSKRGPERILFDAAADGGSLSPDGKKVLFTREGVVWWRKGYRGCSASQIWLFDETAGSFTKLLDHENGCRSPLWKPDGSGFYFVGASDGSFNIWSYDLATGRQEKLTRFIDDTVVEPCLSKDGSTIVFRHLFDFYRLRPGSGGEPERLDIQCCADVEQERTERRRAKTAERASFTGDGLEVAFTAGGNLWVMDTVLREPRQVIDTAEEESSPLFSPDGNAILFIGNSGGQCDLWVAMRGDEEKYWWQNETFTLERITESEEPESSPTFSPDGKKIAFVRGRGDLWIADPDGKNARELFPSWNSPDYDWSPDSKWIVYARSDSDFNRDIWVQPVDGSSPPHNISRHPDNDYGPVWSPDGKKIAFTGRRQTEETDIYYVWVSREEHEKSKRDRSLEEALEKMDKVRKKKGKKKDEPKPGQEEEESPAEEPEPDEPAGKESDDRTDEKEKPKKDEEMKVPEVTVDLDRIHERLHRVSIPDARENGLFWSHDSKKLAFFATIKGKRGTWTLEIPKKLEPVHLSDKTGSGARWIEEGNRIVWLSSGLPATLSSSGKAESFSFEVKWELDLDAWYRAGFVMAWRHMRASFYDGRLNGRDWDVIRKKYEDRAARSPDRQTFGTIMSLMLGELNGSHLGFYTSRGGGRSRGSTGSDTEWREETPHLGVRFAADFPGPGLKVRDVFHDGPADRKKNGLESGETILSIDGTAVGPGIDLTALLNGPLDREIRLEVQNVAGEKRDVSIRPISFGMARSLLYRNWLDTCRAAVREISGDRLGYLHVRGMHWSSFLEFEREIYAEGAGRDGLLIDVRDNGGGFTADHLLTVLCQPTHAITIQRGGRPGYPQDRRIYATWDKPIVVLCNQNSFSNAEIFSHAIKNLGRGKLVGVPTAGGVISTGSARIMDLGRMRMPFRGWFLINDGLDMELNGAVPHVIVWPEPGELPAGKDRQLEKAIEVLLEQVNEAKDKPTPIYRKI